MLKYMSRMSKQCRVLAIVLSFTNKNISLSNKGHFNPDFDKCCDLTYKKKTVKLNMNQKQLLIFK